MYMNYRNLPLRILRLAGNPGFVASHGLATGRED